MNADSSANMARGQSTYRSGPQGAAVKSPTRAASSVLSTTHTVRKTTTVKSSGKSAKKK
jgi:hypothetical protein